MKTKNLVLIIYGALIACNSLAGLVLSFYSSFAFLMVDLGLAITAGFLYLLFSKRIADGFTIGLLFEYVFLGLVHTICMPFIPQTLEDNVMLLIVVGILLIEVIQAVVMMYLSKIK